MSGVVIVASAVVAAIVALAIVLARTAGGPGPRPRRCTLEAEQEARRVLAAAQQEAEQRLRDARIEAREKLLAARTEFERETHEYRQELLGARAPARPARGRSRRAGAQLSRPTRRSWNSASSQIEERESILAMQEDALAAASGRAAGAARADRGPHLRAGQGGADAGDGERGAHGRRQDRSAASRRRRTRRPTTGRAA